MTLLSREPCAPGAPADKSRCPIEPHCEETNVCLIQALRQAGCVAYRLPTATVIPSITCPRCHMTSYHRRDIETGYCVNCHDFTTPR